VIVDGSRRLQEKALDSRKLRHAAAFIATVAPVGRRSSACPIAVRTTASSPSNAGPEAAVLQAAAATRTIHQRCNRFRAPRWQPAFDSSRESSA
jgi:hypothetical protein